jgi:methylated-DNA-[protein]-cysteine S-methyltransferase
MTTHTVMDSPIGRLTLLAEGGALVALLMGEQPDLPRWAACGDRDDTILPALREQLVAYFAGQLREFDVPLSPRGTPFQCAVWSALREVPYGSTCSYADLAAAVGRPTAVRAVGGANGRNPIGIVVPCHRVIGSSGSITGYAGGLDRKRFLLDLESQQRLAF